jgi:hypothetical protein
MKPSQPNEEKLPEKNELFYEKLLLFAMQSSILEGMNEAPMARAFDLSIIFYCPPHSPIFARRPQND